MPERTEFFSLKIDGVSSELHVTRMEGTEAISELFEFEVDFVSEDGALDFEAIVGKPALLEMSTNEDPRFVHGIVSCIEETGVGPKYTNYSVTIVPALWTFGLRLDSCIYQAMNIPDVIKDILVSGGLESGSDFALRLKATYPKREYCVQYRESDLEFVTRLMEEVGIFYFFEHKEDGHVLVLADDRGEHADIAGPAVLRYRAVDTGLQSDAEEVTRLCFSRSLRTGKVSMRSFNFEKTQMSLETSAKADAEDKYEHYDFDGRYAEEGVGKDLAKVRQESLSVTRRVLTGASNCRQLTSGFKFAVSEHPRDEFNSDFVLVRVRHTGEQPQAAGADAMESDAGQPSYSNTFEAIPADITFRPPQVTERGLVEGPQTAVVTGPSGEEIHCDAHGRVKVKFHWDRYGKADDKSSCWVRVSQSQRISDIVIPRVGQEVVVDFLEGDPDQPMIVGRVFNGTNQSAYSLPADKTKTSFRTPSSPGGDGFNEFRFEDLAGSEEVFLHAQKDWNAVILNDRTTEIGRDQVAKIKSNKTTEVGANHTEKIGGDMKLEVAGNEKEAIGGNRSVDVGGNHQEQIKGAMGLTVGGTGSVSIGGDGSISLGGKGTFTVGSDLQQSSGGKMSVSSAGNYSLSAGASGTLSTVRKLTIEVGDAMALAVEKDCTQNVGKKLKITVKDEHGLEAKKIQLEAKEEIVLKAGSASIALKKNGDITIEGGKINIKGSGDVILKGSKITQN